MRTSTHLLPALLLLATTLATVGCKDSDPGPAGTGTAAVDQDEDGTQAAIDEAYTYRLPVIFHVLYKDKNDPTQYVDAGRLAEILRRVNELYRGGLYDSEFGCGSENANIEFQLATHDESGRRLATPGVEYVEWRGAWPIDPDDFMGNHKDYVRYIWEPCEYINVMLYHFAPNGDGEGETLGISHMPYTLRGANDNIGGLSALDEGKGGLTKANLGFAYCSSVNSKYAGSDADGRFYEWDRYTNADHKVLRQSLTTMQISHDINVTLAHELGHYLGLHHVFAEEETDGALAESDRCADTDHCADTPTYNRRAYMRSLSEYLDSLASTDGKVSVRRVAARTDCGSGDFVSYNIMDYCYGYGCRISAEQKRRVRGVLYDSPLMPGPKLRLRQGKTRAATRSVEGIVELPIRTARCSTK